MTTSSEETITLESILEAVQSLRQEIQSLKKFLMSEERLTKEEEEEMIKARREVEQGEFITLEDLEKGS